LDYLEESEEFLIYNENQLGKHAQTNPSYYHSQKRVLCIMKALLYSSKMTISTIAGRNEEAINWAKFTFELLKSATNPNDQPSTNPLSISLSHILQVCKLLHQWDLFREGLALMKNWANYYPLAAKFVQLFEKSLPSITTTNGHHSNTNYTSNTAQTGPLQTPIVNSRSILRNDDSEVLGHSTTYYQYNATHGEMESSNIPVTDVSYHGAHTQVPYQKYWNGNWKQNFEEHNLEKNPDSIYSHHFHS